MLMEKAAAEPQERSHSHSPGSFHWSSSKEKKTVLLPQLLRIDVMALACSDLPGQAAPLHLPLFGQPHSRLMASLPGQILARRLSWLVSREVLYTLIPSRT